MKRAIYYKGSTLIKENFIEQYLLSKQVRMFENTDIAVIVNFNDDNLTARFLIDPELKPYTHIRQFWIALEGRS